MSNEKKIWDFFYKKLNNPYGVAGLMGNLYVESKFESNFLEASKGRKLGYSSSEYTAAVDKGWYTNFTQDSAGYGLVQWTYWSRKEALLNFAKGKNASIGDFDMQLQFIWHELQSYKTAFNTLKTAKSVKEASDMVCVKYEKPANQSESGKANRAKYGQQFFDKYFKGDSDMSKEVIVTTDKVNIRVGNDLKYERIKQVSRGSKFPWVATAENGWHAIDLGNQVCWISGKYSKIQ